LVIVQLRKGNALRIAIKSLIFLGAHCWHTLK
jgi:hypothetical protein